MRVCSLYLFSSAYAASRCLFHSINMYMMTYYYFRCRFIFRFARVRIQFIGRVLLCVYHDYDVCVCAQIY